MEKRKKIGIDLDVVLNNLHDVWLDRYSIDYNDNVKVQDMDVWDIVSIVKPECGEKIFEYLREPDFFFNLDIVEGAKQVIEFLAEHYDLYVVTAYIPETCFDKVRWIRKNELAIRDENIIFINNKSLVDLDYLIDDGPHNFKNLKCTGLIFDMPYNRDMILKSNLHRVNDWFEIKEYFENKLKIREFASNFKYGYR